MTHVTCRTVASRIPIKVKFIRSVYIDVGYGNPKGTLRVPFTVKVFYCEGQECPEESNKNMCSILQNGGSRPKTEGPPTRVFC